MLGRLAGSFLRPRGSSLDGTATCACALGSKSNPRAARAGAAETAGRGFNCSQFNPPSPVCRISPSLPTAQACDPSASVCTANRSPRTTTRLNALRSSGYAHQSQRVMSQLAIGRHRSGWGAWRAPIHADATASSSASISIVNVATRLAAPARARCRGSDAGASPVNGAVFIESTGCGSDGGCMRWLPG